MARATRRLVEAANCVWRAHLKWGPVDDGRPEGDEFDAALLDLRIAAKKTTRQASAEKLALVNIVNALNANPEPVHYKVREAIDKAREII